MDERREYSFRRVYHLKGQTPLIHFQSDQLYCTLRATEVKPRLDAFLQAHASDRIDPSWRLKRAEHRPSLKYQMHIVRDGGTLYVDFSKTPDYPAYYGNAVGRRCLLGNVQVTIICTIPALRDLIDEYIGEFFLINNFGALKSKGFGSYIVEDRNGTPDEIAALLKREYGVAHCYAVDAEKPFRVINVIRSVIKSGLNLTHIASEGGYERSLLFTYLHDVCGLGNEKAWIKQTGLVHTVDTRRHPDEPSHPPRYARALLGVTTGFRFRKNEGGAELVRVKSPDRTVKRHRSPLMFKVVGQTIYFFMTEVDPFLYGCEFEFFSDFGRGTLRVPTKEELGDGFFEKFMTYCVDRLNGGVLDTFKDTHGLRIREVGV